MFEWVGAVVNKWLVIGGIALVVLLINKRGQAEVNNPYDIRNWEALPGYNIGSGLWV